jgi:hybrid cluster-associated redox disulfide protein
MKKESKKVNKVTKDSNIAEVVYKHPESVEVFMDYGLHCVGCSASAYDTIESGAKIHGLSDKDIGEMIERLNEVINFKE